MLRLDRIEDLPGLKRVAPQRSTQRLVLAALAAAAWPPLLITLLVWPPENWASGVDTDWRLVLLVLGLIAAPVASQPAGTYGLVGGAILSAVLSIFESWRVWRADPDRQPF